MKYFLTLLSLIAISCSATRRYEQHYLSQDIHSKSISVAYSIPDGGFGGRWEQSFGRFGYYGSGTIGTYHLSNNELINPHLKFTLGGMFIDHNLSKEFRNTFSLGASYHYYGTEPKTANRFTYIPVSFDIGTGIVIKDFVNFGFMYDPLKKDVQLYFGIMLK